MDTLADTLARVLGRPCRRVRLPYALLLAVALGGDLATLFGRPLALDRARLVELTAEGWVCSVERARDRLGFSARIDLSKGFTSTAAWYARHGLLAKRPDLAATRQLTRQEPTELRELARRHIRPSAEGIVDAERIALDRARRLGDVDHEALVTFVARGATTALNRRVSASTTPLSILTKLARAGVMTTLAAARRLDLILEDDHHPPVDRGQDGGW